MIGILGGGDPVNGGDPTGLCTDSHGIYLVPGTCEFSNSKWVSQALNNIHAQYAPPPWYERGLEGVANFGAGIANTVVSGITLGNVHISAPFCQYAWAYDVGGIYADVAVGLLGVGEFDAPTALEVLDEAQGVGAPAALEGASSVPGADVVAAIKTPYGAAIQGSDAESLALRQEVDSGATVYRTGVTGTQETAEGQFWAGENPATTPGYAHAYGTPGTPVTAGEYPWIMGGTVEPGTPFVTRFAPSLGPNLGGTPEVVVNPGGVSNLWFHMPD